MSIIIRNLGGDMEGWCEYEVRINEDRITTFRHDRNNGLAVCLQLASDAVKKSHERKIEDLCKCGVCRVLLGLEKK